jgi:hypothetical protein
LSKLVVFIVAMEGMGLSAVLGGLTLVVTPVVPTPLPVTLWLSLALELVGVCCFLAWAFLLRRR